VFSLVATHDYVDFLQLRGFGQRDIAQRDNAEKKIFKPVQDGQRWTSVQALSSPWHQAGSFEELVVGGAVAS